MAHLQDERCNWGSPKTSKETLDDYWSSLLQKADHMNKEEIKFFLHCTTLKGKKGITKSGRLVGGFTNLPARAPLASFEGMKGIWLAMSTRELPTRSPYGTQRMVFRVRDIMTYMGQERHDDVSDGDSDDRWDAEEASAETSSKGKKQKKSKDRKKKSGQVNRNQKECYLKNKIPKKIPYTMPLLFFECAHYYGSNQYVRLLLVRNSDPRADWCREMCKPINIHDNPFFHYLHGRLYTYSSGEIGRIFVEVLLVGDIEFEHLLEPPEWDEIGTLSRAGFDPRLGIC